jgi:23S rRNA (uracil1939-C5)-methyltransferase
MGHRFELDVDRLAYGGEAVGREASGRVVFVPGGAPGDRLEVELSEERRGFARAYLLRVVEPSATRVEPPCPVWARCGGCPFQHVAMAAQLEAKADFVRQALRKSRVVVRPAIEAPEAFGYRTRTRMHWRKGAFGFSSRRSHEVISVDRCLTVHPALERVMREVGRLGAELGEGASVSGVLSQGGGVHLAIETGGGAAPGLRTRLHRLLGDHELHICGILLNDEVFGAAEIELETGFFTAADGFQQASGEQNTRLRREVADALQASGMAALELYAGDGNFTRDLVRLAKQGVVSEADPRAVARLRKNIYAPHFSLCCESAAATVQHLVAARVPIDVVLLDPPRVGAAEILEGLSALAPRRIVYVSCDPMTLGRDVLRLEALGYRAETAQPIDMMPQTSHIETVLVLTRR